jgi:hypothetical protein
MTAMRTLLGAIVLVLVVGDVGRASATPFAEIAGGLAAPISDNDWTNAVDPSLKLAVRFGSGGPAIAGMGSVDWTPLAEAVNFVTFNRFRVMGHVQLRRELAPKLMIVGRFGAGIDVLRAYTEITVLGTTFTGTDTDTGLALEAGVGGWFTIGEGRTQLGVELALPVSYHSSNGNPNNPNDPNDRAFDFTSIDVDVLAGVRVAL